MKRALTASILTLALLLAGTSYINQRYSHVDRADIPTWFQWGVNAIVTGANFVNFVLGVGQPDSPFLDSIG